MVHALLQNVTPEITRVEGILVSGPCGIWVIERNLHLFLETSSVPKMHPPRLANSDFCLFLCLRSHRLRWRPYTLKIICLFLFSLTTDPFFK